MSARIFLSELFENRVHRVKQLVIYRHYASAEQLLCLRYAEGYHAHVLIIWSFIAEQGVDNSAAHIRTGIERGYSNLADIQLCVQIRAYRN